MGGNNVVKVCTKPELKQLLERAEEAWNTNGPSFLCSSSKEFYQISAGYVNEILSLPQGTRTHEQVEPVRYSKECAIRLKNTEAQLRDSMESQDIEELTKALQAACGVK